jgi:hypothetical protein
MRLHFWNQQLNNMVLIYFTNKWPFKGTICNASSPYRLPAAKDFKLILTTYLLNLTVHVKDYSKARRVH